MIPTAAAAAAPPPLSLREAPSKVTACSNGIWPNSVSTPPTPLKKTDALWEVFFAENEQIL